MTTIVISTLYKFVTIDNFESLKKPLLQLMEEHQVKGTLLLAKEGINGTIASNRKGIDALLDWLRTDSRFANIASKESYAQAMPFYRGKVKLKKEIVTMGIKGIDPKHLTGTYVKPQDWNALIADPEVLLIDTRNNYEIKIGAFKGAVNPETKNFREFPQYVADKLKPSKHKKIAMYCTGGIRCEKSTAFLKQQGFEAVYHLQGGILKYLAEVPAEQSMWQGECFVFDNRIAINQAMKKGQYDQCYACRHPINQEDKNSQYYSQGISCPHCYEQVSEKQRQRFQEREKQVQIAKKRGEEHIGSSTQDIYLKRRMTKWQHKEQQRKQKQTS